MNYIESAIEEEFKIVGRYANLQIGIKLFHNSDNAFEVCAYHYVQGDWIPLGDADDVSKSLFIFASEGEKVC